MGSKNTIALIEKKSNDESTNGVRPKNLVLSNACVPVCIRNRGWIMTHTNPESHYSTLTLTVKFICYDKKTCVLAHSCPNPLRITCEALHSNS